MRGAHAVDGALVGDGAGKEAVRGDVGRGGLEADDVASRGGHAQRTAGVRSVRRADLAFRHRNRGAGRGAAGRAAGERWGLEHRDAGALGVTGGAQLGSECFAGDGRAGVEKHGHDGVRAARHVAAGGVAVGGGPAGDVNGVLDRDVPARESGAGRSGSGVDGRGRQGSAEGERRLLHGNSVGGASAGRLVGNVNEQKVGKP